MQKVLLVYEDFSEMMETHNGLKKVGFDVVAVTNELSTADQVISMNPDLVIASGKGPKVSSLGVGKRLKELVRWRGKSLMIIAKGQKIRTDDILKIRVDQLLEGPIEFEALLSQICKLFDLDEDKLLAKLHRSFVEESDQVTYLGNNMPDESEPLRFKKESAEVEDIKISDFDSLSEDNHEKKVRDKKFKESRNRLDSQIARIQRELEQVRTLEKKKVQKYLADAAKEPIRKEAGIQRRDAKLAMKALSKEWDTKELKDLDEERREFVKALFQKKTG